jgi:hypothetical protein
MDRTIDTGDDRAAADATFGGFRRSHSLKDGRRKGWKVSRLFESAEKRIYVFGKFGSPQQLRPDGHCRGLEGLAT